MSKQLTQPLIKLIVIGLLLMVVTLISQPVSATSSRSGQAETSADLLVQSFGGFGENGSVVIEMDLPNISQPRMNVQPDGKVVVTYQDGNRLFMFRYNVDGTLDSSFHFDGILIDDYPRPIGVTAIDFQSDGKIIVAGNVRNEASRDFFVYRYTADGHPDSSFTYTTTGFGGDDYAHAMAIQQDDKIIVAGEQHSNGENFAIARYLPDGGLDASFHDGGKRTIGFGGIVNETAQAVEVQDDGKIVVMGSSSHYWSSDDNIAVARLHPNGTLDDSFDHDGKRSLDNIKYGRDGVVQADSKIIMLGSNSKIMRFNADGSVDSAYADNGILKHEPFDENAIDRIMLAKNGNLLLLGSRNNLDGSEGSHVFVASYTPDGQLDQTFGNGAGRGRDQVWNPLTIHEYTIAEGRKWAYCPDWWTNCW